MTTFLLCLAVAVVSYLLGSIMSGILISKYIYHDDIRAHGSGSAGMTNMLRTYGKKAAILTALGDALKGITAVLIARWLFTTFALQTGLAPLCGEYLAMAFAIIGHFKPLYFGFKGGKGVVTGGACLIIINPVVVLMMLAVFLITFGISRMVSLGSILAAGSFPVFTILYGYFVQQLAPQNLAVAAVASLLMGGSVIYMHRSNIKRIRNGTEYRFDGSHKKK